MIWYVFGDLAMFQSLSKIALRNIARILSVFFILILSILTITLETTAADDYKISTDRIEESKQMLIAEDKDQPKILAIAYDVGFNNLGSFNRAFKRHTGKTPTEYKKRAAKPDITLVGIHSKNVSHLVR